ncbi:helix-turn-helix domain-containing protein [Devosia sp. ZB163]|uniref:helix-turn-helix domain-containing protein n=1 Tax=Devosia sp. ZB163 TaxID=3025938 RepID=UPI002360FC8C|nr:helix-turn-helix domain-containing protein [Devosia sp. ZB163]MDC9824946.1 helix-turn-helix domain-containing protein [Devosia sp. ZB163]
MENTAPTLIEDAEKARQAMTPLRLRMLALLREPASAATLAAALALPRQKVGYHLHALEKAGLVTPAGERQRRGFTERLFVARAGSFVVDPAILGAPPATEKQDRFAAEHLVARSAETVREVTRMQAAAAEEGTRLITFTIEADIGFAAPRDVEAFTERLTAMVAELAGEFAPPEGGRRYRLLIGGHPAIKGKTTAGIN